MISEIPPQVLFDALKQAMAEPGEQRLYKSGKLPGLFPGRSGANGEMAAFALREGLLEVVRTETKGKSAVEWARITPKGTDLLLSHESPVRAMDELCAALQATREGIPVWLAQIHKSLEEVSQRLTEEVHNVARRLEALSERIMEALRRGQTAPKLPAGATDSWAQEALTYLDRRREGGIQKPCPLPELFGVLRAREKELSVNDYHAGLRRLQDRGTVTLLPFEGPGELPEPEYALLDGAAVYYYVARSG
jgi:hypothetical protein